jgi:hypothetical protein
MFFCHLMMFDIFPVLEPKMIPSVIRIAGYTVSGKERMIAKQYVNWISGTTGDVLGKSRNTIVETSDPRARYPKIPTAVNKVPTQIIQTVKT